MKTLTYFIALLALGGCAHDFRALYATETRVVKETEYDQGMRNHIDKLQALLPGEWVNEARETAFLEDRSVNAVFYGA